MSQTLADINLDTKVLRFQSIKLQDMSSLCLPVLSGSSCWRDIGDLILVDIITCRAMSSYVIMIREILVIFLLFLPSCQAKVCGYEVSWKTRTDRVSFLQTVVCQTAGCPEESIAVVLLIIPNLRLCSPAQ